MSNYLEVRFRIKGSCLETQVEFFFIKNAEMLCIFVRRMNDDVRI